MKMSITRSPSLILKIDRTQYELIELYFNGFLQYVPPEILFLILEISGLAQFGRHLRYFWIYHPRRVSKDRRKRIAALRI
jgi:hypothetical protein